MLFVYHLIFIFIFFLIFLDVPLGDKNAAFGLPSPSAARSSTKERWADNDRGENSDGEGSDGDAVQGSGRNQGSISKGKKDFTDGDILDIQVVRHVLFSIFHFLFHVFCLSPSLFYTTHRLFFILYFRLLHSSHLTLPFYAFTSH
jgi:hypothetical protein